MAVLRSGASTSARDDAPQALSRPGVPDHGPCLPYAERSSSRDSGVLLSRVIAARSSTKAPGLTGAGFAGATLAADARPPRGAARWRSCAWSKPPNRRPSSTLPRSKELACSMLWAIRSKIAWSLRASGTGRSGTAAGSAARAAPPGGRTFLVSGSYTF